MLFNGFINDLEDGTGDPLQNWEGTWSGAAVGGQHRQMQNVVPWGGWPQAPRRAGDPPAGKQLGVKGRGGPGGQAEDEAATPLCQDGQLHAGSRNRSSQQAKGNEYSFLSSTCETTSGERCLVLGSPAQGQPAHSGTSPAEDHRDGVAHCNGTETEG